MTTDYAAPAYQRRRQLTPRAGAAPQAPAPQPAPQASVLETGVPLMTRLATADDRALLAALQRSAAPAGGASLFADPSAAGELLAAGQVIVAERGADALGFAVIRPRGGDDCELLALVVEPGPWCLPVARLLVEHGADAARRRGALTLHATVGEDGQRLHQDCGFEWVETHSTRDGPAHLLRRPLACG